MVTAVLPNDDFHTNVKEKRLEIFCLVWLDTEQKLRSVINYLKKFQDVEQRLQKDRLVLIVRDRLGREIISCIHHLRQVMSIYVYCKDKKGNEQWACKFAKVKDVFVALDELIPQITEDHEIQKKVEDPLSINMFTTNDYTG